jgi:hypothetical protein
MLRNVAQRLIASAGRQPQRSLFGLGGGKKDEGTGFMDMLRQAQKAAEQVCCWFC